MNRIEIAKARYQRTEDTQPQRYSPQRYSFDQSKHPRGQPKNAGQFAEAPHKTYNQARSESTGSSTKSRVNAARINAGIKSGVGSGGNSTENQQELNSLPPVLKSAIEDLGPLQRDEETPPPPGGYNPDPSLGKAARVGVPGDVVPPPPKRMPKLNNLTPEERNHEQAFAKMFESDPDGLVDKVLTRMQIPKGEPGYMGIDGPNVFGTDDVKMMYKPWEGSVGPDGKLSQETLDFRSTNNTALHQTANALAKKAFVTYLDSVVAKLPDDKKNVLVTAGGVAAGKGYAIENIGAVNAISKAAAATWDTAGEQNSTELDWVANECKKRNIKMTVVFVHANPASRWDNPKSGVIERAGKKGRMVDARLFADSYTYGARNFHKFATANAKDPNVDVVILDNTRPPIPDFDENGVRKIDKKTGEPAMRADIVELPQVPKEMLTMDPEKLYANCLESLDKSSASQAVKDGGSGGVGIWGPPKVRSNKKSIISQNR